MPDRLPRAVAALAMLALPLSGCVYAGVGATRVAVTPDRIVTNTTSAAIDLAPAAAPEATPSRFEAAYARDTGRVLFRQAPVERSAAFVTIDPVEGYSLCLRSGTRLALLVFPRRILAPGISQADDDIEIRRGELDTAPCRNRRDYIPAA